LLQPFLIGSFFFSTLNGVYFLATQSGESDTFCSAKTEPFTSGGFLLLFATVLFVVSNFPQSALIKGATYFPNLYTSSPGGTLPTVEVKKPHLPLPLPLPLQLKYKNFLILSPAHTKARAIV
jgi:hypothetical protein